MSSIHFDPYFNDEYHECPEKAPCGIRVGENYQAANEFKNVTCKRCLNQQNRLTQNFQNNEQEIIKQMGEFADFLDKNL